jgi:RNA polymerase sigma-70 factor (ECF subfamily)
MSSEARFRELFSDHYPAVARYVLARGFQAADADDLIAATFEVAWRRLDAVPAGESAVPWLLAAARNLARNAERKTKREQSLRDSSPPKLRPGLRKASISAPSGRGYVWRSGSYGASTAI